MAGRSVHDDVDGCAALLSSHDFDVGVSAAVAHDATDLGEDVVGPYRVEVHFEQVLGTLEAAGLLVGDGEKEQGASRPEPLFRKPADRDRHRRGLVQHVDRAASPHLTVDELASERVARPPVL